MTEIEQIHRGDCIAYMKQLPDNFFDLCIADPPYGDPNAKIDGGGRFGERFDKYKKITPPPMVNHGYGGRFSRYNQRESILKAERGRQSTNGGVDWDIAPPQEYFDEMFRVSKNQIIWGGNYFDLPPTRCFLVWNKTSIPDGFSMAQCEYAWTSLNGNAKMYSGSCKRTSTSGKFHPTEKPIALYQWILKNFAKEGDKIFDPNMGSQASRIAAATMGFDYWGCEIDEYYFQKGCEQFDKLINGIQKTKDNRIIKQTSLFD